MKGISVIYSAGVLYTGKCKDLGNFCPQFMKFKLFLYFTLKYELMQKQNNSYDTLSEAQLALSARGYSKSFKMEGEKLKSMEDENFLAPEDLTIIEYHRFEGSSDPNDMAVIYAIETKKGEKGIIIDAYGADGSRALGDFLKNTEVKEKAKGNYYH